MSRITTLRASLSCARAAIRRACSMGVKRLSVYRARVIQPVGPDDAGNLGRNIYTDVGAGCEPGAQLARGDRRRLDLEEEHALGAFELREHLVEALLREARPRRDRQPGSLEHLVGIAPRRK